MKVAEAHTVNIRRLPKTKASHSVWTKVVSLHPLLKGVLTKPFRRAKVLNGDACPRLLGDVPDYKRVGLHPASRGRFPRLNNLMRLRAIAAPPLRGNEPRHFSGRRSVRAKVS